MVRHRYRWQPERDGAVVKLLLETGKVDITSRDSKYGQTPLSWAARKGHKSIVRLLLETGKVDIESKSKTVRHCYRG